MRGRRAVPAAVAATLVAGVVSAAARTAAEPGTARLAARPAAVAPTTPLPTPTSPPTPTSVPTPKVTPTVRPTLPAPTSSAPTLPVTQGGVPTPAAPPLKQGRWRHARGGVTVDVRISPAHPRAGDLVTWTVAMSSTGKRCCNADISYGDGHGAPERNDYCGHPSITGTAKTETFRHAYRTAGVYTTWLHVVADCSDGPVYLHFRPKVLVTAGPLLSNGPWQPVVTVADSIAHSGADPDAGQYFVANLYDHDGYPVTARWDWGDGSADTVDTNDAPCWRNPRSGWPEGRDFSYVAHTFPEPGTYTVRVTGTTRGCDGRQPQTVAATMTWTGPWTSPSGPLTWPLRALTLRATTAGGHG